MRRILSIAGLIGLILVWTDFAGAEEARVRVMVAEGQKLLNITVEGGYTLRSFPDMRVLKRGRTLIHMPLVPTPTGFRLGREEWVARAIRIEPSSDRDLYLNKSRFRGAMTIHRQAGGLLAVNDLPMESYLYGVLHHEAAVWWPMEAQKAQAVAARTYALYQLGVSKGQIYDLKSSTSSQVYGGSTTERYRSRRAVDETRGKVLSYQGKVFPAYFHATCAGRTAAASELWKISLPPLGGKVPCGYCRVSPHYSWERKIPLADLEGIMKRNGRPVGRILDVQAVTQTPSGRVGSLKITGTAGEMVIAAKDFRVWIGGAKIRSTAFTVRIKDDIIEFKGRGWGHGVGLCQWGAFGQSLLGRSYDKILQFYYPGAVIAPYAKDIETH